jgi:hypothetical protein
LGKRQLTALSTAVHDEIMLFDRRREPMLGRGNGRRPFNQLFFVSIADLHKNCIGELFMGKLDPANGLRARAAAVRATLGLVRSARFEIRRRALCWASLAIVSGGALAHHDSLSAGWTVAVLLAATGATNVYLAADLQ